MDRSMRRSHREMSIFRKRKQPETLAAALKGRRAQGGGVVRATLDTRRKTKIDEKQKTGALLLILRVCDQPTSSPGGERAAEGRWAV